MKSWDKIFFIVSVILSLAVLCVICDETLHRKLSYKLDLNCPPAHSSPSGSQELSLNLVHVAAVGPNDTIHYIWSTYGFPTVIVARTNRNASLGMDCDGLKNFTEGSLYLSEEPTYAVALILRELWQFEDPKDTSSMFHGTNFSSYNIGDFVWSNINESFSVSNDIISASSKANGTDGIFLTGGTVQLQFAATSAEKPSTRYPHLRFTGNSTEVSLMLLNLNSDYKKSRFAAGLTALTWSNSKELWNDDEESSINDEYSPGVFKVKKVLSPCSGSSENCKGFISWKPVAYIGSDPTVANSSDAAMSSLSDNSLYPASIATAFFGNTSLSVVSWNMTFGTSGDGFYTGSNYTNWSLMMGLGQPLSDSMSLAATLVITIGLGTPVVIFVAGAVYMGYKRCRKDKDDLLLEG